ncbi:hypothetical protein P872_07075 [Rhodonellum psychrophilum GCM71 = DSM 17998]|uniref:Uncharacterized protein n=2 Tax=Rhodonellum TaxID=336827 RepID=U5BVL5_9BACT|nr:MULTISPECIES: hypothetical protein [Rhodonellum]ERM81893.1 hypothetical protein P872_07075 [Rhodonellum psychrophilum GCM71 = DSM 17998]MDO9553642.1 hypothetical protein [Rhodonellum sp.]SDY68124.1 hypothetical protein SAMN05444412_102215 [Rhodonellum ikkaensis]
MKPILIFTLKVLSFSLVIAGIVYSLQNFIMPELIHESVWKVLSFFALLVWASGLFVQYLMKLSKENSSNILLGATVIRFIASAGFVAILLVLGVENKILFVANFFAIYFLFLLFDIYSLMANLRPHSK